MIHNGFSLRRELYFGSLVLVHFWEPKKEPRQWAGIVQNHCSERRLGMIPGTEGACWGNNSGGKWETSNRIYACIIYIYMWYLCVCVINIVNLKGLRLTWRQMSPGCGGYFLVPIGNEPARGQGSGKAKVTRHKDRGTHHYHSKRSTSWWQSLLWGRRQRK